MENNRTIQRKHTKKRKKPKVRFNFWVMFIIFFISFSACFVLYMIAANINDDFFAEEQLNKMVAIDDNPTTKKPSDDVQPVSESVSVTNPVPQSDAVDESYFNTACLATDSTLLDMGSKGKFDPGNVFGSEELNASNCNSLKIESSFGTVSVYELVKNKKPPVLYMMLGSDLGTSTVDEMIKNYKMLVSNLHSVLPDMKIYVMQLPPIIYDTETLTNEMINDYNKKLIEMCNSADVYCIDTNTALKSGSGSLSEEYFSYETLKISVMGYEQICQYIRTHTV